MKPGTWPLGGVNPRAGFNNYVLECLSKVIVIFKNIFLFKNTLKYLNYNPTEWMIFRSIC
jgi:hypothetical protein